MSSANRTVGPLRSKDNFTAIFEAASSEYETVTGRSLRTHPLARELDSCDSPEAVSIVLRTQAQAFSKYRNNDEGLMRWLNPIVHILFMFSTTVGEGVALSLPYAKAIFIGIGILLMEAGGVVSSYKTLMQLFEQVHFFLQRLNSYTKTPLTNEFTELLGKIMAQTLSILALSTKAMAEWRIKIFLKRLAGKRDIEDALLRLDLLTKEEDLMVSANNLEATNHILDDVKDIKVFIEDISQYMKTVKEREEWNQMQEKLRTWLFPPDPSTNHNDACKTRHDGTARWFTQSRKFQEWKRRGSLLWILGNPGVGKSILCSAIIEDIKSLQEERSLLVTYHYFDFNNTSKRHVHGLLASLLSQLSQDSSLCQGVLYQLFKKCRNGSERPSLAGLVDCFKTILKLPGQLPIFVIIDALDECPHTTGTPSAREEVLRFVADLVQSSQSNLFICITSRPEQDIRTVLNPLTSESRRVALHEESGQVKDINNYVRFFVHTDTAMKRWKEEDKELVINTLSERASGMFRWVYCQLDTLRRCLPSSIKKTLNELPQTLDGTYKRTLQEIPEEKKQPALRLFQFLFAAVRPLRVEELAESFAMEFDLDTATNFREDWRSENPEEDIISTCSTLITIIDDNGSKFVQFSHYSVREFLTSERLQIPEVGNICHFHITQDAAHTILARACLAVLLQLDEDINKDRLATYPLAFYAAQKWFVHAKHKEVAPQLQDAMDQLFNPKRPHLAAWLWICDVELGWIRDINTLTRPSPPNATALYYAVSCGLCGPAKYLISQHGEDVNARCGSDGSPLHTASRKGHLDAVSLLLDYGADVNITNKWKETPLCAAYAGRQVEVMGHLLGRGATVDIPYNPIGRLIHNASWDGQAEVLSLLLQHGEDINGTGWSNQTPFHFASTQGRVDIVQILLDHGADINAVSDRGTSLYCALLCRKLKVIRLLLEYGADVHICAPGYKTPFQVAANDEHPQVHQRKHNLIIFASEHKLWSLAKIIAR